MTKPEKTNVPIGSLLKKVDQLPTNYINQAQAKNNVTGLEWQTLNTLFERQSVSKADLLKTLSIFTNETQLSTILDRFQNLGWIEAALKDNGLNSYSLTSHGVFR